jgi:hypothetical protein
MTGAGRTGSSGRGWGGFPIPRKTFPRSPSNSSRATSATGFGTIEEKRREYLALGVAEYWIIDRFQRTMTVYRNPPRAPAEQVLAENEVYRTDLLPGFELPLARLFATADKWPGKKKRKRK